MIDFNTLKQNRQKNFEELTKKLNSGGNTRQQDERYWKVTRDATGNGSAIIRFLPAPPDGEEPYVASYDHAFQDKTTGKWYIEKSLNTIGKADPCSEYNSQLWNSGNKDQARHQKRRTKYHSNILVVKDPANPENDGKTFLFEFGKKILDKITEVMQKTDDLDDDVKFNPFDLWDGANFRLRVSVVDDYPNYDKSKFESPTPVADSDEEIEQIWRSQHSLDFLTDAENFKTYEELQKRLNDVLGLSSAPTLRKAEVEEPPFEMENTQVTNSKEQSDDSSDEDLEKWLKELANEE